MSDLAAPQKWQNSTTTQSKFTRTFETIQEFVGDDLSDNDPTDERNRPTENNVVAVSQQASTNVFLLALLEHLSSLYVKDPKDSKTLFQVLAAQLVNIHVLPRMANQDDISSLRAQYKVSFSKLVHAAVAAVVQPGLIASPASLQERARIFFQPRLNIRQPLFSSHDMMNFHTSRYQEEFTELDLLGRGAYGSVYKVRNNLDGCEYAVKKISFQSYAPEIGRKIIREVKNLASMTHKNIVRYHCAWLEAESPLLDVSQSIHPSFKQASCVPAITFASISPGSHTSTGEDDENDSKEAKGCDDDEDDSVVFEEGRSVNIMDTPQSTVEPGSSDLSSHSSHREPSSTTYSARYENIPGDHIINKGAGVVILHIQMELCTNTLKEWILKRNKVLPCKDRFAVINVDHNLKLLRQILKAVSCIHASDILHRDVKPKNIFLSHCDHAKDVEVVKIGDFGLARHLTSEEGPLTPHPGATEAALCDVFYTQGVGTTIYAAPEQLLGDTYNEKCDMYSVGLIIFELYQPFATEMERYEELKKLREQLIPTDFQKRWPKEAGYVEKLLHVDPSQRPSAEDLLKSDLFLTKDQIIKSLMSENQSLKKKLFEKNCELYRLKKRLKNLPAHPEK